MASAIAFLLARGDLPSTLTGVMEVKEEKVLPVERPPSGPGHSHGVIVDLVADGL